MVEEHDFGINCMRKSASISTKTNMFDFNVGAIDTSFSIIIESKMV